MILKSFVVFLLFVVVMRGDKYLNDKTSHNNITEIINDLFYFEYILELKRRIKDMEVKGYIAQFLMNIIPVTLYEIAVYLEDEKLANKNELLGSELKRKIQKQREFFVKYTITKSSKSNVITDQMGMNFEEKTYDLNIILSNGKLSDFNYEDYFIEYYYENINFWNELFLIPHSIINFIFENQEINQSLDDMFSQMSDILNESAHKIEFEMTKERYCYSVERLFSKSTGLTEKDKILILYRYRLLSSINYIEPFIPNIKMEIGDTIILDAKLFFRKQKALIIDIFYNEIKDLDTEFSLLLKDSIDTSITEKKFFSLNRKVRNNIHYGEYKHLTESELKIVELYQEVILKTIKDEMDKQLYIYIDDECRAMTEYLKECHKKGLSEEEIIRDHRKNYIKFIRHGEI